ncbi:hypothetical protein [Streptosporangium amethystogenes]|uniref:hypothetical protein n=1 Tax=Streptosporangium amethystogenes TaxID=2002 RepID=UPI0004C4A886|nr:hypothetical protein [Streptosporangium amethystogenes]
MSFDGFLVPDFAKPYIGWVVGMDWPELELDISVVFYGAGKPLVMDVDKGLYLRLTPEGLAGFNAAHPGVITR